MFWQSIFGEDGLSSAVKAQERVSSNRWTPPPDPLEEESTATLSPLPGDEHKELLDYVDRQLAALNARLADPTNFQPVIDPATGQLIATAMDKYQEAEKEKMAWQLYRAEMEVSRKAQSSTKQFYTDFQSWLLGKGREKDHLKTPWYRTPVKEDSVHKYLEAFVDKRMDYLNKLALMKFRGPQNVFECYLYYKYIVRGEEYKQDHVSFLSDWDKFSPLMIAPDDAYNIKGPFGSKYTQFGEPKEYTSKDFKDFVRNASAIGKTTEDGLTNTLEADIVEKAQENYPFVDTVSPSGRNPLLDPYDNINAAKVYLDPLTGSTRRENMDQVDPIKERELERARQEEEAKRLAEERKKAEQEKAKTEKEARKMEEAVRKEDERLRKEAEREAQREREIMERQDRENMKVKAEMDVEEAKEEEDDKPDEKEKENKQREEAKRKEQEEKDRKALKEQERQKKEREAEEAREKERAELLERMEKVMDERVAEQNRLLEEKERQAEEKIRLAEEKAKQAEELAKQAAERAKKVEEEAQRRLLKGKEKVKEQEKEKEKSMQLVSKAEEEKQKFEEDLERKAKEKEAQMQEALRRQLEEQRKQMQELEEARRREAEQTQRQLVLMEDQRRIEAEQERIRLQREREELQRRAAQKEAELAQREAQRQAELQAEFNRMQELTRQLEMREEQARRDATLKLEAPPNTERSLVVSSEPPPPRAIPRRPAQPYSSRPTAAQPPPVRRQRTTPSVPNAVPDATPAPSTTAPPPTPTAPGPTFAPPPTPAPAPTPPTSTAETQDGESMEVNQKKQEMLRASRVVRDLANRGLQDTDEYRAANEALDWAQREFKDARLRRTRNRGSSSRTDVKEGTAPGAGTGARRGKKEAAGKAAREKGKQERRGGGGGGQRSSDP